MPPKRRARGADDDNPVLSRGGAAVTSNLPPLASRLDTSYGSAPSTALRNTRRGQRRDLQAIIKETLHDSDDPDDPDDPDDDDDGIDDDRGERSRRSKGDRPPPKKSPTPEPAPQRRPARKGQAAPDPDPDPDPDFEPDFGPGRDLSESPEPPRDPAIAKGFPRQRLPGRIGPSGHRSSFHQGAPAPHQRVLPDVAPPRGPSPSPQQPWTRGAGSKGLAPPAPTNQGLSPSRGITLAPSSRSVFARAISEEPAEPAPTPDSVRTFGQESSLYEGAAIGSTPSSRHSRSPEESEEESPTLPMPPRSNQPDQFRGPVRDPINEVVHQPEPLDWPRDKPTRPSQQEPPSTPLSQRYRLQSETPRRESPSRSIAGHSVARDLPRINPMPRALSADPAPTSSATRSSSTRPSSRAAEYLSAGNPFATRLTNHVDEEAPSAKQDPAPTSSATGSSSIRPSSRAAEYLSSAANAFATRLTNHVDEEASTTRQGLRGPSNHATQEPVQLDHVSRSHLSPRRPLQQASPSPVRRNVPPTAFNEKPAATQRLLDHPPPVNIFAPRPGGMGDRSAGPSTAKRLIEEKDSRPAFGQRRSGLFNPGMQEKIRQEREHEKAQEDAVRKERNARLQAWPRIYNTVYSWTHAPRPDSPPPRNEDSDGYDSPIQAPLRLSESSWSTWILFKLADTFVDVLNFLFSPHSWHIKALLGILLVSLLGWAAMTGLKSAPALGLGGIQWYGLSDISHNLGQFVPLWMSRPTTMFSDEDTREYIRQHRNHEYELSKLTKASKLHEGSLSRLEEIVPKIVHMRLDKHGRPVIGEEFWHALRDLMKGDTEILTMDRGSGGYHFISEEHWRAIRDRLKKDPVYQSAASPAAPGPSTAEIEEIAQTKFEKSWEKWLKTNDEQVAKILEPALTTSVPDKIGKDLESKIEKIVKDRFKNTDAQDVVVTRNEFIRHLKSEFATHRNEVKAEAQELQKKLEHYVNNAVKSALQQTPPAGVSRAEMAQVVDGMIRQAIANAGLEALAQGKIGATWDRELRHQVNFLGRHTGVLIDRDTTTPDCNPPIEGKIWSSTWFSGTKKTPEPPPPASATLWNWEDEGDCWCGKVTVDKGSGLELGVSVGYLLAHQIIPQHVVVEHILPGATLDPDARPKRIDVLGYFEELNTRNRVMDFSAAHFPHDPIPLKDGWVRIGHFTYESSDALNGVYVHRLSPELVSMGAVTDQVVLRATSNYGSDHTCLYRVRLYGEKA
ncbi:putative spindle pole body-associated protein sad1 [Colletotrichum sublineola]|uniref:Putative spindle pole body-associated protein sad1 n=1 Tax=Colletotrichum sublineola TaxID=1173701 RepID=A0A066XHC9_COLSU|nr:putative spindle pole body-associated protein sad1 [Colletotrichum sublineola]